MEIKIEKISKEQRLKSPDLITRPIGRLLYKRIKKLLKIIKPDELVILDFQNIKVIDSSFIDEFLVKLISDSQKEETKFHIKLKNISEITEINIDSVFKSYSLYNDQKIAVITDSICKNNSFFIGTLNEDEKDVIDYLRINKIVSVDELSDFIGKAVDQVRSIMNSLILLRLVRGNKNNIYETL